MGIPTTILRAVIATLLLIATVFTIAATAGEYWVTFKDGDLGRTGLWKTCSIGALGAMGCGDIPDGSDKLNSVRAFMIMSCIAYALAIVLLALIHFKNLLNVKLVGALFFVVVLFEIIAMSIYTDYVSSLVKQPYIDYGWSYGFGWTSTILSLIAGILCFFDSGYAQI